MTQEGLFIFKDVPTELAEGLLNSIAFSAIPPAEQERLLNELEQFAEGLASSGKIKRREETMRLGNGGKFKIRRSVPQRAADILNRYTYGNYPAPLRGAFKRQALEYLKKRGIPLYKS